MHKYYFSCALCDHKTGSAKSDAYVGGIIYQESAEVAAQYKQAYALATVRLQEAIANVDTNNNGIIDENETPLDIVTDIDGTLLDDSTYFAGALLNASERSDLDLQQMKPDFVRPET